MPVQANSTNLKVNISAYASIVTSGVSAIATELKDLIEANKISFGNLGPEVLTPDFIPQIATIENVRKYTSCKKPGPNFIFADLDRLAPEIVGQAPRLFVLTVAKDYPTLFLQDMIEKSEYKEEEFLGTLLKKDTPVSEGFASTMDKARKDQAFVYVPKFQQGKYDYNIVEWALPITTHPSDV